MRIAVTRRDLRLAASFTALSAAVALLVADSPGPTCARYEAVDETYLFETTCTPETTTGEVHFVVAEFEEGTELQADSPQPTLVEQAAAGGLYLEEASVTYDISRCSSEEVKGTGRARGFSFVVLSGPPPVEEGEPVPEAFSCYFYADDGLDAVQTYSCGNRNTAAEKQSCTLTLTPKS